MRWATRSPSSIAACAPADRRSMRWRHMRRVIEGNARSARDAGLAEDAVQAWQTRILHALDGIAAVAGAARARRLRPPRARRSASRQSLSLARPAGAVRRAGIRRGDGDDRPWLRSRVPADGSGSARLAGGGEPRVEPLRRAHRRRGADARAAGVPVAARDGPRACRGEARAMPTVPRAICAAAAAYLHPPPPIVVAIGGLPGSGKSTLARALAPDTGRRTRRAGAAQRRDPQAPARRRAGAAPAAGGLQRRRERGGVRATRRAWSRRPRAAGMRWLRTRPSSIRATGR